LINVRRSSPSPSWELVSSTGLACTITGLVVASLGEGLVAVEVERRVVGLDGLEVCEAVGVGGVLGDGGEGEAGEGLVSVVLRSPVRFEGGAASLDLVDGPRAWHDEAGGPVGRAAGVVWLSRGSEELVPLLPELVDGLGVREDQRGRPVGLVLQQDLLGHLLSDQRLRTVAEVAIPHTSLALSGQQIVKS